MAPWNKGLKTGKHSANYIPDELNYANTEPSSILSHVYIGDREGAETRSEINEMVDNGQIAPSILTGKAEDKDIVRHSSES